MTPTRKKIQKIQGQMKALEDKIRAVQDKCTHPKFVKGLTIVACVQECWICDECGYAKPLYNDWFAENPNG